MKKLVVSFVFLFCNIHSFGQKSSFDEKAEAYIREYSAWAIEEQQRVGIPAAITLAQGIYETGAGESELATKANNHFGIKCKKEWTGMTFAHTDDAPDECFRKYNSAQESYKDHSDYLKNSARYDRLFTYPVENYTMWAKGLKKCGYATNPAYASKLIKMVEDYDLQQFTIAAKAIRKEIKKEEKVLVKDQIQNIAEQDKNVAQVQKPISITEAADRAREVVMQNDDGTFKINDLRAFHGKKGEMLLDKAMKFNIRYARLLEINELADEPLPRDMPIFLEAKKFKGMNESHLVQEGETIEIIAHNEGMGSRQLRIFNLLAQNEQPVVGSMLSLQKQSDIRPDSYKMERAPSKLDEQNYQLKDRAGNSIKDDFLPTKKTKQTEEIEIGIGAEMPDFLKEKAKVNTDVVQVQERISEKKIEEQKGVIVEAKKEEPVLDEFAILKAKLDKAVYSQTSKSNIKVSSTDQMAINNTVGNVLEQKAETPNKIESAIAEQQFHVVEKGDTGYSIAKKYGIKVKQLNEWNNLNFEGIKIGQKLRVK